jgi:cell division protein DivIC
MAKIPKIFFSKIFLAGVVVVLLVLFGLELQQWQERRKIDAEISHIIQEQTDLEKRNTALQQSLEYFSSDTYKEKLAREQLGLKKEGEIVINFPAGGIVDNSNKPESKPQSNPLKWWEFIFKKT